MANGFRFTGPACCCCTRLYVGLRTNAANDMRRHDTAGSSPGSPSPAFSTYGRSLDFDPVHKRVFVTRGIVPTDNNSVFRYDEEFGNQLLLTTLGSDRPDCITSDSDNELAYFTSIDTPTTTTTLHVVAHDGTGYAAIGALTNTGGQTRNPIHYCRANGKLYYCSTSTGGQRLYRVDTDGTNDTLIATSATLNGQLRDVTVDNDNSLIYWVDNATVNGATSRLYRSDLDGAGVTLLLTGAALDSLNGPNEVFYGPQWSHSKQRLYYWMQDSFIPSAANDATHGLFSMQSDGSDIQFHISRGNGTDWWSFGTETPFDWRIACGFETLGAGSTA